MNKLLENKKEELQSICKLMNVKTLYAFGSVVSDRFNESSDIDFLLSFPTNLSVEEYMENYFALHYKLREIFDRDIELITERTLSNPYFIESVNETKQLIYDAGN